MNKLTGMRQGKRTLSVFLVLLLCFSMGMSVAATDMELLTPEEQKAQQEMERLYGLPIQTNELSGWPQGPGTYGEAGIVMEVGSGAILYAKNIDDHHYPASITKTLTTLVAMENSELDDKVTFSADSLSFLEWGDAAIGMQEGDVISMEEALYAVLLASANEVSYAVAESIGKSKGHDYSWYIDLMNTRCQELGGMNSHFVNPHGLHDENHYTCARDMALIGRALFKYPVVFDIMQSMQYTIEESDTTMEHIFQQNHKMFYMDNMYYWEDVIGGKTGYTDQSRNTLVTMTDNGDMQLVCVVLRTEGYNVYSDTRNLCEYVYDNFEKLDVAKLEKSEDVGKIITKDGGGYVVVPDGVTFEMLKMELTPDKDVKGEAVLTYTYEGNNVGEVRAKLSDTFLKENPDLAPEKESGEDAKTGSNKAGKMGRNKTENRILAVSVVILILLIGTLLRYVMEKKREKKRRRRRMEMNRK
ncbi:D-alanyl-D-alanine carboxypeptidase [Lachnospiraceae bacterium 42-17]